jgi:membrane-bound lytic murein transglycosylase B
VALPRRIGGALGWAGARLAMGGVQGMWRLAAWRRTPRGGFVAPLLLVLILLATVGVAGALLPGAGSRRPAAAPVPGPVASPSGQRSAPEPSAQRPLPGPSSSTARPVDGLTTWARQLSPATGIPVTALKAYGSAQLKVALTLPGCHLLWTTLAGIGQVESGHGTAGGATLTESGLVTPLIIGPALDGTAGRQLVRDSDLGHLDGDPRFDHAIGPMQFLPATWGLYQADGDGDDRREPADLNDAALAAANFLCDGGRDLATAAGWAAAIRAYNPGPTYAQAVFTAADRYGKASRSPAPTPTAPVTPTPTHGSTT